MPQDDDDLPYGEDFHDPAQALAWAYAAATKRPFRTQLFARFAQLVNDSHRDAARILELGAGPGFLAEHLLDHCPSVTRYTLLDFSEPMHALSSARLQRHAARTEHLITDFKQATWTSQTRPPYDFLVSLQAIHELRHKRHAPKLYAQLPALLSDGGRVVICDHLPESGPTPKHAVLYLTIAEQLAALSEAGFTEPRLVWSGHAMGMYAATR